ncbi:MAG: TonB family protein [Methylococcaceae bacterium]|nr:TonB family protein [Methylococcaceae bacterium]MCI0668767.1 TonB family protein [Methylococcaceae bacterium]MCI0732265.1 TonB family protein [Methylococcaceae bacterium]
MNEILTASPPVSATDRLMVTVFLAILVHALLILGIRFELEKAERIEKSLEIALVDNPTRSAPEKADFLAQANQIGSGSAEKISKPQSPKIPSARIPRPEPGREPQASIVKKKAPPVLTRKTSEMTVDTQEEVEEQNAEPVVEHPELTAAGIYQQIAALSSEISLAQQQMAKRPRIKFINSVNAHQYKAAAYEKAWQHKVERIGNLNYPDQARREHLSGSLLLAVGIRKDGTVYRIEVRRSSGHQALDDGAIRIVRLSAPFAYFPEELAKEADVLVITRTWKFSDDSQVTTSR